MKNKLEKEKKMWGPLNLFEDNMKSVVELNMNTLTLELCLGTS